MNITQADNEDIIREMMPQLQQAFFTAFQKVIAHIFTGAVLLIVSFLYQRFKQMIFGEKDETV